MGGEYSLELQITDAESQEIVTLRGTTTEPKMALWIYHLLTATPYPRYADCVRICRHGRRLTEEDLLKAYWEKASNR